MRSTTAAALACAIGVVLARPAFGAKPPAQPNPGYSYASTDVGYLSAQGGGTATTLDLGARYLLNRHYGIEGGYFGAFV